MKNYKKFYVKFFVLLGKSYLQIFLNVQWLEYFFLQNQNIIRFLRRFGASENGTNGQFVGISFFPGMND